MFKRLLLMGLFSLGILASEIALTRIFSVIFWYHFGFLIISTSLLGFGMAGVLLRLFKNEIAKRDPEMLVVYGVSTSGLLLAASLSLIAHHHFSPLSVSSSMTEMSKLVIASLVLLPPFVVMGGTVIFMLQQWSKNVGKLYAANLIGSGIGCMVVLLLMDAAGGLIAYIAIAAFMPFIAALFVFKRSKLAFGVNLALALIICSSLIAPYKVFPVEQPEGKVAGWAKDKELVYSDWTSLSKVDIFKEDTFHKMGFGLWGLSLKNEYPLP